MRPRSLDIIPDCLNQRRVNNLGGIAQLGERLHGMQEVSGSIPLTSTKTPCGCPQRVAVVRAQAGTVTFQAIETCDIEKHEVPFV